MNREHVRWLLGAALLWLCWLGWLWQPQHQLRLHQQHLLHAIEARKWQAVSTLMADDYADPWGGSKQVTPGMASAAFRQFLHLSVHGEEMELQPGGTIRQRVRLGGDGNSVASEIISRVNALSEPFTFQWVHRSSWPWDWELLRVEQPELRIEAVDWQL